MQGEIAGRKRWFASFYRAGHFFLNSFPSLKESESGVLFSTAYTFITVTHRLSEFFGGYIITPEV